MYVFCTIITGRCSKTNKPNELEIKYDYIQLRVRTHDFSEAFFDTKIILKPDTSAVVHIPWQMFTHSATRFTYEHVAISIQSNTLRYDFSIKNARMHLVLTGKRNE